MVNDNQRKGVEKVVDGTAKELAGKATGSMTEELKGKIEKEVGKLQTKIGNAQAEHAAKSGKN